MKLNKPLSEYTTAGLLFLGRRTDDPETAEEVLAELRRRRRVRRDLREARSFREMRGFRLDAELEIEGLRSLDKLERRAARRKLYDEMLHRALDRAELPADAGDPSAARSAACTIDADAKAMYNDHLRLIRQKERLQNREQYKVADRDARGVKCQRLPIIGEPVRVIRGGEYENGTVRRYRYHPALRRFVLGIETADGRTVERAVEHVTPQGNVAVFRWAAGVLTALAVGESAIHERDKLRARVEVYRGQLARLEKQVADYKSSEFYREWGDLVAPDDGPESL